jgi:crotonobetainyl-CoA:carnitine CoA-transferase CaiB-like acyl-CoA transferase
VDEAGARDTWVAIAVATDAQWLGLRRALGEPGWAIEPELATESGRRRHHDAIDRHLGSWCAERPADEIVDGLWGAAVPVARVMQPHEQATLPQLQFRRFFEQVDHPVAGTARYSTLPMRFSRGPDRFHRRPAPLLGEHTDEVLRGLGVSDAELARLHEEGVIGRTPDAAKRASG